MSSNYREYARDEEKCLRSVLSLYQQLNLPRNLPSAFNVSLSEEAIFKLQILFAINCTLNFPALFNSTRCAELILFFIILSATQLRLHSLHFRGDEFFKKQFFSLPFGGENFLH